MVSANPEGDVTHLPESNYENNVSEITVTIPDHKGRQSVGPLKNEPVSTTEPID